jgi:uncharacterized protein (UPF0276 family)
MSFDRQYLGHGVGLRNKHYSRWLSEKPQVDWVEVISENFMCSGGRPLAVLEKVRRDVPVVLHGVALSIGSTDPLSATYLANLRNLAARIEPAWVSDHLCWGSHGGRYGHDLWPLPYTEETVDHVVRRVRTVQDVLKRQILLENVSSYVNFESSTMTEWEFLAAIANQADCGILLDVNNIFVSARNHGFDPSRYIQGVPPERVGICSIRTTLRYRRASGSCTAQPFDASVASPPFWNGMITFRSLKPSSMKAEKRLESKGNCWRPSDEPGGNPGTVFQAGDRPGALGAGSVLRAFLRIR